MIKKWYFYSSIAAVAFLLSTGFRSYDNDENIHFFSVNHSEGELYYDVPTPEELAFTNIIIPQTGKTYAGFKQALAFKESQGKYHLINALGYMGKYQFGPGTLRTIGVHNFSAFLNSPSMQEKAFNALLAINKWELRREIEKYNGKIVHGIKITESGLLAAAHLGGAGSVKKFLRSDGSRFFRDGFGTSIRSYMKHYAGYDTTPIVASRNAKVRM